MEARLVGAEQVRPFFEAHPHPNVLDPLEHPELKRYIALFDEGQIVAAGTLQRRALGVDQLGGMIVRPDRQGSGVGRALMDAALAEAIRAESKRIVCGVYRREPDVAPYYRAMGFTTVIPYIPGDQSAGIAGAFARVLARVFRVASGPDAIRIMSKRI